MHRTAPIAAMALLVAAAGAVLALPAEARGQDYYGDIRPLLVQNCLSCHMEDGPGWSMEDAEETYVRNRLIAAMVLDRLMPPWIAEEGHQEYVGNPTLSAADLDLVRRWREGGFPKGDPRPDPVVHHAATGGGHGGHHGPFRSDLSLDVLPGGYYLPNQSRPDDYRCFVVDWTETEPRFITGFRARPGNLLVSHHTVVHAVNPEMAARFRELEEMEEGAGYQCFGGALPDRLGQRAAREAYEAQYPGGLGELNRSSFWLAHWAPGMDGHTFPEGTGIYMEPGSALVVQMHYYAQDAPGERDENTLIDFAVAESVERPAFNFSQTRGDWLVAQANRSMVIPAGEQRTYQVTDNLEALIPYIARVTRVPQDRIVGLELHSANLHMHAFGHSGDIHLLHPSGQKETLLSVPRWDLRWQRDFTFVEPKVFPRQALRGVTLGVRCTFENWSDETVFGGYGSYDEMCFNFSYIAVRIADAPATGEEPPEEGARPEER
jgi:hypothetical protein